VASGANDRRGFVRRVLDARNKYRGPFCGKDIQRAVEAEGFEAVEIEDGGSFLIFTKDGCNPVPVNPDWEQIYDDDPTFRCIQRDLGISQARLRSLLNKARDGI
jgi:hypothetical protein